MFPKNAQLEIELLVLCDVIIYHGRESTSTFLKELAGLVAARFRLLSAVEAKLLVVQSCAAYVGLSALSCTIKG